MMKTDFNRQGFRNYQQSTALLTNQKNTLNSQSNAGMQITHADKFQKTNSIPCTPIRSLAFQANKAVNKLQVISFSGKTSNDFHDVISVAAEAKCQQGGGVAVVFADFPGVFNHEKMEVDGRKVRLTSVIPYYNGDIVQAKDTAKPTGEVKVLKKDGKPIWTKLDISEGLLSEHLAKLTEKNKGNGINNGKDWLELEEISKESIEWFGKTIDAIKYGVVGSKDKDGNYRDFMIFNEATARMPEPYGKIAYATHNNANDPTIKIDPYAQFSKAVVQLFEPKELNPADKKAVVPQHFLLHDAQLFAVPHFMDVKAGKGSEFYKNIVRTSAKNHNVSDNYQGKFSAEKMFYNLASNEQIQAVHNDPEYKKAKLEDTQEKYFKKIVGKTLDENESANTTKVMFHYLENGQLVTHASTVSEKYAEQASINPLTAPGLTGIIKKHKDSGKFSGINNGLDNSQLDPALGVGFKYYDNECTDQINGETITHQPFKKFNKDMPIEEINKARRENSINLLQRLQKGADPTYFIGIDNKKCELIGHISQEVIDRAKEQDKPLNLFVSWGRGDEQKGIDNLLDGFARFAKTKEGEHAVLFLGGPLEAGNPDDIIIRQKMTALLNDKDIAGRVVYGNGFVPGRALADAGDVLFTSRREPCGLTHAESLRYAPIIGVTRTGYFDGLITDPLESSDKSKINGFKTTHSWDYFPTHESLINISKDYKENQKIELKSNYENRFNKLLESEKGKLKRAEYTGDLEKEAKDRLLASDKYKKLAKEVRDEIMAIQAEGLFKNIATCPDETKAIIKQNCMNAPVGWFENGGYSETGKPSAELLLERHLKPDVKQAEGKGILDFPQEIYERAKNVIKDSKEKTGDIVKDAKGGNKNLYIGAGAVAVLAAIGAYFFIKKPKEEYSSASTSFANDNQPAQNLPVQEQPAQVQASPSVQYQPNEELSKKLGFFAPAA